MTVWVASNEYCVVCLRHGSDGVTQATCGMWFLSGCCDEASREND